MASKRFQNKVVLVTGGARGIGKATCERFGREGSAVVVTDFLDEEGEAVAKSIRDREGRAIYVHLDVSSEKEWKSAIDAALTAFGRLDVLVNNAGVARLEDVEQETLEGYKKLIEINQVGVWLGMKACMSELKKTHGSIINVSSIYGASGGNGTALAYHASKGAVRLMTKNAAIRYAKEGVRVNSIHPGFIETPMIAPFTSGSDPVAVQFKTYMETTTPMGRIGRPEEVAGAIAFLASVDASYITGSELYVDGGWTAA
jgi:NAD(P)-dependent dehydrogenase (short-subunit alcohol dehydrogenase family)